MSPRERCCGTDCSAILMRPAALIHERSKISRSILNCQPRLCRLRQAPLLQGPPADCATSRCQAGQAAAGAGRRGRAWRTKIRASIRCTGHHPGTVSGLSPTADLTLLAAFMFFLPMTWLLVDVVLQ